MRKIISILILLIPTIGFAANSYFIDLGDMHFNPFAACVPNAGKCALAVQLSQSKITGWDSLFDKYGQKTFSKDGQDSNYLLLQSFLHELKIVKAQYKPNKIKFVLYLGDWFAHGFNAQYQQYVGDKNLIKFKTKILRYLTRKLRDVFPNIPVYPLLGNNDTYGDDYSTVSNGKFLNNAAKIWEKLFISEHNRDKFKRTFSILGYYEIKISSQQLILALNTVPFSPKATGPGLQTKAMQELTWLTDRLKQAEQEHSKVWLVFHIPLGIDAYGSSLENSSANTQEIHPYWQEQYSKPFLQTIKKHARTIEGILVAHSHMDTFAVVKGTKLFVSHNLGVSPIFGNNPGFKVFSYDPRTFKIFNFISYSFSPDTSKWQQEYSFKSKYPLKGYLKNIFVKLVKNYCLKYTFKDQFINYYSAGNKHQKISEYWMPYYWCAIRAVTVKGYAACLHANN